MVVFCKLKKEGSGNAVFDGLRSVIYVLGVTTVVVLKMVNVTIQ